MDKKQNPINDPVPTDPGPCRLSNAVGFGLVLQGYREGWRRRRTRLGCLPFQELRGLGRAVAGTWSADATTAAFPWLLAQGWPEGAPAGPGPGRMVRPLRFSRTAVVSPQPAANDVSRLLKPERPNSAQPVTNMPEASRRSHTTAKPLPPEIAGKPSGIYDAAKRHRDAGPISPSGVSHTVPSPDQPAAGGQPWPGRDRTADGENPSGRTAVPASVASGLPDDAGAAADQPPILQRLATLAGVSTKTSARAAPSLAAGSEPEKATEPVNLSRPLFFRPNAAPEEIRSRSAASPPLGPMMQGDRHEPLPEPRMKAAPNIPDAPTMVKTVEEIVTRHLQRRETRDREASLKMTRPTSQPAAAQFPMAQDPDVARRQMDQLRRVQQSERFRAGHIR